MINCVKYIVFRLLVLLMIVEWILQHVQTELKTKKSKTKQNKTKKNKNKKTKTKNKQTNKQKKRPTDQKFWSMLYQYKNVFRL